MLHALNFLQAANPRNALGLLAKVPKWKATSAWIGDVYGLAIGVTTVSPVTGKAIAAI